MGDEGYSIACAEVVRILDHIPYKDYKKIPKDVILYYEENASDDCDFEYDVHCSLDEQNVSKTAKTIIAVLYRDYWATPEQKRKILNYEKYALLRQEKMIKKLYGDDNLFKEKEKENNQEKSLEVYKENNKLSIPPKGFKKLLYKIINFFKRKK